MGTHHHHIFFQLVPENIFGGWNIYSNETGMLTFSGSDVELAGDKYCLFDEGTAELAMALEGNTQVNRLFLATHNIGDEGVMNLCRLLHVNFCIIELHLTNNLIGDKGALEVANLIEINHVLKCVNLFNNLIGDIGGRALWKALETNTGLIDLCVYGNNIPSDIRYGIRCLLNENRLLRPLQFWSVQLHGSFPFYHTMIMASLVCGGLPVSIWCKIFSFWQREGE